MPSRAQLISAVALRMDEITPSAGLTVSVDGSDNNPLATLIDGIVDDGVLELFSVAPYWRLPQTAFLEVNTLISTENGRKYIRLKLGEDFLRVAEISCPDFQRPITEVVTELSPMGKRQHNRYLMAKEAKPVGVMSHGIFDNTQVREIDCYSLSPDSTVTTDDVVASYIAKPAAIASTGTSAVEAVVPPVLIPALEWLIAARAFGARGDADHAGICQQNAQNLMV